MKYPKLCILLLCLVLFSACGGSNQTEEETNTGVAYIQAMEAKSADTVVAEIKTLHREKLEELKEERLQELEEDPDSVWSMFEDYVILGDSRAVGFWYYCFLPQSRVLAEGGATIRSLEEHITDLVELQPDMIFCCYGLNDVSIGYWNTPEEYVEEYAQVIAEIWEELPNVTIYISSILPARDPAFETSSKWRNIPEYSEAVREMCEELGCIYIDNDEISETYASLWDIDGIHVQKSFYCHWAANMIVAVYSSQLEQELDIA